MNKPLAIPKRPQFGSGPTVKNPQWKWESLQGAFLGQSHRSPEGKKRLKTLITLTKDILEVPASHCVGIIAGSATGAMECLMWSLLGPRPVDVISFDVFSSLWEHDICKQLKLPRVNRFQSPAFAVMPDLLALDSTHDWVFNWNGTTSGLCFPDGQWIPQPHEGLTFCDATSAAFSVNLPWEKLDAVAFSWQKGLGGEGGFGMIVLSPKAMDRLKDYVSPWPIPRIFRLTHEGTILAGVFEGETINTPSLLCVEDCLAALNWAKEIGGLPVLVKRCHANYTLIEDWVRKTDWVRFAVNDPAYRSQTSVCLEVIPPFGLEIRQFLQDMKTLIEQEGAGYDFVNHTLTQPSLRIWTGPTVEQEDLAAFLPWLTWAYELLSRGV